MNKEQSFIKEHGKPHPFLAGIIDFYFLSIIVLSIWAAVESVIQRPIFYFYMPIKITVVVIFIIELVTVILYHKIFTNKVSWLSLGEIITGRSIEKAKKVWVNPYRVNRLGIFLIVIITTIIIGNEWDRVNTGYIYSFIEIIVKIIRIVLMTWGMIILGKGNLKGIFILVFFLLLSIISIQLVVLEPEMFDVTKFAINFYSLLSILYIFIYIYYVLRLKKISNEIKNNE